MTMGAGAGAGAGAGVLIMMGAAWAGVYVCFCLVVGELARWDAGVLVLGVTTGAAAPAAGAAEAAAVDAAEAATAAPAAAAGRDHGRDVAGFGLGVLITMGGWASFVVGLTAGLAAGACFGAGVNV